MSLSPKLSGAVLVAALCTFGCAKEQTMTPTPDATTAASSDAAAVRVVNNRLVFTDYAQFERVRAGLMGKSPQDVAAWHAQLGFRAIQGTPATEGQAESAETALLDQFHFPASYAALINPAGQYQVGDKIYWFHDGYKYEAGSEQELQAIQRNPASASRKFQAGARPVTLESPAGNQASRTIRYGNDYMPDYKYTSPTLYMYGDGNSKRRLMYSTYIYQEDVTGQLMTNPPSYYNLPYKTYYTVLVFNEVAEYYSSGTKKWKRAGEQQTLTYNLNLVSYAVGGLDGGGGYWLGPENAPGYLFPDNGSSVTRTFSYGGNGNQDFKIDLAACYVTSPTPNQPFTWDYRIIGTITGYFSADPSHTTFSVAGWGPSAGGNDLW